MAIPKNVPAIKQDQINQFVWRIRNAAYNAVQWHYDDWPRSGSTNYIPRSYFADRDILISPDVGDITPPPDPDRMDVQKDLITPGILKTIFQDYIYKYCSIRNVRLRRIYRRSGKGGSNHQYEDTTKVGLMVSNSSNRYWNPTEFGSRTATGNGGPSPTGTTGLRFGGVTESATSVKGQFTSQATNNKINIRRGMKGSATSGSFDNWLTGLLSKFNTYKGKKALDYIYYTCHSACHSSCHSAWRGRR